MSVGNTFLVLGAGYDQIPLIKAAKNLGLEVVAIDGDPNCPGRFIADHFWEVSNRDLSGILGKIRKGNGVTGRIMGVATMGSDIPEVVEAIKFHVGLPCGLGGSASVASNKFAMKIAFHAAGVRIPFFEMVSCPEQISDIMDHVHGPVVVKPIDSAGSRGVSRVDSVDDTRVAFERAIAASSSSQVLVERLLTGSQLSSESLVQQEVHTLVALADRNYLDTEWLLPRIVENGGWFPSEASSHQVDLVNEEMRKVAKAFRVVNGVVKGDLIVHEGEVWVIEAAARLGGGDFASGLVAESTGKEYVSAAVQLACNRSIKVEEHVAPAKHHVANRYLFLRSGEIKEIRGIDEVCEYPWLIKIEMFVEAGQFVGESQDHSSRAGVFLVRGNSREELKQRISKVYETVQIVYQE